jgi:hypothetical protein
MRHNIVIFKRFTFMQLFPRDLWHILSTPSPRLFSLVWFEYQFHALANQSNNESHPSSATIDGTKSITRLDGIRLQGL